MSALSNSLNYASVKRKSVSARNYRAQFRSVGGLDFGSGSQFTIELGAIPRSYVDGNNMYLQFEIESLNTTGVDANLDYSAYSIFNRIVWSSGNGAVLEDTNYLNVYSELKEGDQPVRVLQDLRSVLLTALLHKTY